MVWCEIVEGVCYSLFSNFDFMLDFFDCVVVVGWLWLLCVVVVYLELLYFFGNVEVL